MLVICAFLKTPARVYLTLILNIKFNKKAPYKKIGSIINVGVRKNRGKL